ncbi:MULTISPECIES: hypothetical protein [Vibrio]|uniref:hypothetical protein n=1 Tax=Vibrio TaxID=662 RepID=UPI00078BE7A9|nr:MULTISPECIES: hypothetical protein [Vibrio]BAU70894.1 hypothetical protein [Vibrio sp. 04Ya108]BBM67849.1 hypothetical protein VA249_44950 [Vibrio alfacsensis]BCN27019.1 hypothetical protein VYA_42110 [Vibrio alfacsensis]
MELENLAADRDLVVIALQALHRERVTAYNSALTYSDVNQKKKVSESHFCIYEVTQALRRIGAAPSR